MSVKGDAAIATQQPAKRPKPPHAVVSGQVRITRDDFSDRMLAAIAGQADIPEGLKPEHKEILVEHMRSGAPFDTADIPGTMLTLWLSTNPDATYHRPPKEKTRRALAIYCRIAQRQVIDPLLIR